MTFAESETYYVGESFEDFMSDVNCEIEDFISEANALVSYEQTEAIEQVDNYPLFWDAYEQGQDVETTAYKALKWAGFQFLNYAA